MDPLVEEKLETLKLQEVDPTDSGTSEKSLHRRAYCQK